MFDKKDCSKCGKKISSKYEFCPHCGKSLNNSGGEDWGMLGKDDRMNEVDDMSNLFGGVGGKMLGGMFNSAMKMLEKEMQKEMKQNASQPKSNFQLFINGKKVDVGELQCLNLLQMEKQKFLQKRNLFLLIFLKNNLRNSPSSKEKNLLQIFEDFQTELFMKLSCPG